MPVDYRKDVTLESLNATIAQVTEQMRTLAATKREAERLKWFLERKDRFVPIAVTEHSTERCCDCNEDCPLARECANHTTAGDFRMEGGMTPALLWLDGKWQCTKENTEDSSGIVSQRKIDAYCDCSQEYRDGAEFCTTCGKEKEGTRVM